jgi:GNAT superfamily N-acetyltransferase
MESRFIIRRYQPHDLDEVRDLFVGINRELAPPPLRAAFDAYIDLALREEMGRIEEYYDSRHGSSFWIAIDEGRLAGMFGLERLDDESVELRRMYVEPTKRRSGIARLMLRRAEELARAKGFAKMVLSTSELQTAAIALYRSAGYRLVREQVATSATNKTVGSGVRRFYFEKPLTSHVD